MEFLQEGFGMPKMNLSGMQKTVRDVSTHFQ